MRYQVNYQSWILPSGIKWKEQSISLIQMQEYVTCIDPLRPRMLNQFAKQIQSEIQVEIKQVFSPFFYQWSTGQMCLIFFLCLPSYGGHLFLTPSIVYISVINTHITNYNLSCRRSRHRGLEG